jgi:hypothetical protein
VWKTRPVRQPASRVDTMQGTEGEIRWMGETCTRYLATRTTTNGQFCLVEENATNGETVPLHRNVDDVESFFALDGEITFYADRQPGISARHGEFYRAISIPADASGHSPDYRVEWGQGLRRRLGASVSS